VGREGEGEGEGEGRGKIDNVEPTFIWIDVATEKNGSVPLGGAEITKAERIDPPDLFHTRQAPFGSFTFMRG
jgi:hypothetical protein